MSAPIAFYHVWFNNAYRAICPACYYNRRMNRGIARDIYNRALYNPTCYFCGFEFEYKPIMYDNSESRDYYNRVDTPHKLTSIDRAYRAWAARENSNTEKHWYTDMLAKTAR